MNLLLGYLINRIFNSIKLIKKEYIRWLSKNIYVIDFSTWNEIRI